MKINNDFQDNQDRYLKKDLASSFTGLFAHCFIINQRKSSEKIV